MANGAPVSVRAMTEMPNGAVSSPAIASIVRLVQLPGVAMAEQSTRSPAFDRPETVIEWLVPASEASAEST